MAGSPRRPKPQQGKSHAPRLGRACSHKRPRQSFRQIYTGFDVVIYFHTGRMPAKLSSWLRQNSLHPAYANSPNKAYFPAYPSTLRAFSGAISQYLNKPLYTIFFQLTILFSQKRQPAGLSRPPARRAPHKVPLPGGPSRPGSCRLEEFFVFFPPAVRGKHDDDLRGLGTPPGRWGLLFRGVYAKMKKKSPNGPHHRAVSGGYSHENGRIPPKGWMRRQGSDRRPAPVLRNS